MLNIAIYTNGNLKSNRKHDIYFKNPPTEDTAGLAKHFIIIEIKFKTKLETAGSVYTYQPNLNLV